MLACLTILLFCTSVLAVSNGRIEVIYPSLETSRFGIKIIKFRAFDQDIILKLEPAGDVISDDFTVMDEEGKIEPIDVESFKGKLFRDQEKGAALYIDENEFIEIEGIINFKLRIEPSESQKVGKYGMKEHVITETFDEKKRFKDTVNNLNSQRSFLEDMGREFDENQCVEIEYYFLGEKNFTEGFPDLNKFKIYIGTVFVQTQTMMDTLKLKIKIRALGVLMLKSDPPFITKSLFVGEDVFNMELIAKNMETYLCENKGIEKFQRADIIMLLTGRQIGIFDSKGTILVGVLGVANLGRACAQCTKLAVVKCDDDKRETAVTLAHESAHLLGSPHDGEGDYFSLPGSPGSTKCVASDGFIMGDSIGENKEKFSTCSVENIKYFLGQKNAHCLIEKCKDTVL
uniref:Metalloserrulase 16 n=2 Tax=Tityus serrulatus TaxID=6887 RepID=A0A1S5QN57_TITSE|nr:metalloserrulase 16 [Tityus serrulatus]